MRVAVIGSGVSGLVCAHLLQREHDVTVLEADRRVGGHVNTVTVACDDGDHAVDTGFIVYNEENYPAFSRLLAELGVATQPSDMSFSVSCAASGLEYRTTTLSTLFAQRRNVVNGPFLRLLGDVLRFNRAARELVAADDLTTTLESFLAEGRYSRGFVDHYLVPLGASIWSADPARFTSFPAAALARFLDRHGLLSLAGRPQWRTVTGGSQRYVERLVAPFRSRIRTGAPVLRIERDADGVDVFTPGVGAERFDRVVLAVHSDQALRMLAAPTAVEAEVLGAIPYQHNRATLHTDATALPRNRRAWASWNYAHLHEEPRQRAAVTYHANRLQGIRSSTQLCTTLNREDAIDPATIVASFDYEHPVFDGAGMAAQRRHGELNGTLNTWYAGAYWGWGFHEDGVQSAIAAMRDFGVTAARDLGVAA